MANTLPCLRLRRSSERAVMAPTAARSGLALQRSPTMVPRQDRRPLGLGLVVSFDEHRLRRETPTVHGQFTSGPSVSPAHVPGPTSDETA